MADDISKERFHSTADAGETAYELNSGAKIVWKDDGGGASISASDSGVAIDKLPLSIGGGLVQFLESGAPVFDAGDSTATPGAAEINKPTGQSKIALGAASVVVTNDLVQATSIVLPVLQTTNDATLTFIKGVSVTGGSFTITCNATATAAVQVGWIVFNGLTPE